VGLRDKVDILAGAFYLDDNGFNISIEMADRPLEGAEASSFASNSSGLLMRVLVEAELEGRGGEDVEISMRTLYTYSEDPAGDGYVFTTFYWEVMVDYVTVEEGYGNYSVVANTMIFGTDLVNTTILGGSKSWTTQG